MNWLYKGEVYNPDKVEHYGFIYEITFEDGDGNLFYYLGKKNMVSEIEVDARKDDKPREGHYAFVNRNRNGKRTKRELLRKENRGWKKYLGSSKETEDLIPIQKEILEFAETKRQLTYLECKYLFSRNCIEDEKYLNKNILKRFFRDNLV